MVWKVAKSRSNLGRSGLCCEKFALYRFSGIASVRVIISLQPSPEMSQTLKETLCLDLERLLSS